DIDVYRELDKEGLLPVRMRICLEEMYDKPVLTEEEKADPYRMADFGTFKIFTDGSFGARSAALLEDYDDDPGNKGILVISQDALNERIYQAYKHGLQPATHCIGDAGTEACLQAIEYTVKKCIEEDGYTMDEIMKGPKFRVIHAQLVHRDQLERFKKVPVIFDIQPVFLNTDLHWIDERIGSRADDAYTWKTYLDEGIICTGGSDCPVESYNPWPGIWGAVNRTDPLFPDEAPWHPEQKLSKFQAACLFSKYMAYGNQMERYLGTIEPGKFADMIVTDRDWLNGPDDDILNVKVLKTYLAGDEVYSAE
ncbi:MAG: amidohydrolase family protein, partial [Firmicutes bacterium]|nr:amidohydrolase family protein [Bacillota bacterium]